MGRRHSHALALFATILFPAAAGAWGPLGHQIVADVAEHYLTPEARAQVDALLGDHVTMAVVADWPDQIRDDRPETGPWHYVNLPPEATAYVPERDCRGGRCVVAAIEHFAQVVADRNQPREARRDALKFLIHFVGDIHQPMHCGNRSDRGGNDVRVTFFKRPANLHELWDTLMLERQRLTPREYADELILDADAADRSAWLRSCPGDWAVESHDLAQRHCYLSPSGRGLRSGDTLGRTYYARNLWIADQQLARAGVRLAGLINAALDGAAAETGSHAAATTATQPAR
jgi:nuclease S1